MNKFLVLIIIVGVSSIALSGYSKAKLELSESTACLNKEEIKKILSVTNEQPIFIGSIVRGSEDGSEIAGRLVVVYNRKTETWSIYEDFSDTICLMETGSNGKININSPRVQTESIQLL